MSARRAALAVLAVACLAGTASSQIADSARVGVPPRAPGDTAPSALAVPTAKPPITPTKALFESLVVPGWGQASLDRGTAGVIFVGVEVMSIAMIAQSKAELRAAERLTGDSVLTQAGLAANPLQQVVGQRQAAVEDWTVLLIFNHLIAAADAFVAAHLWNVPIEIHGSPSQGSASITAHVKW